LPGGDVALDSAGLHDLVKILEKRYGRRSTIVTSQLPADHWHEIIGDPTYADAKAYASSMRWAW
jgi:DNA replication protein DnaC